jgi:hypothetical protein
MKWPLENSRSSDSFPNEQQMMENTYGLRDLTFFSDLPALLLRPFQSDSLGTVAWYRVDLKIVVLLPEVDASPSRKHDNPYRLWLSPAPVIEDAPLSCTFSVKSLRYLRSAPAHRQKDQMTSGCDCRAHIGGSCSFVLVHQYRWSKAGCVTSHACMHLSISALPGFWIQAATLALEADMRSAAFTLSTLSRLMSSDLYEPCVTLLFRQSSPTRLLHPEKSLRVQVFARQRGWSRQRM